MLFQRTKHKMNGKKQKIDRKEKERNRSLWGLGSLSSPMGKASEKFSGKVSFCIFFLRKASLAVETALVLPIFFLGMVTLISFMDIYKIQTEHLQALCEKTKEAGMYAYVLNEKGPEKITLPDVYSYTPPGGIIGLPKIWMYNTVTVHAWTGADIKNFSQEKEETEKIALCYGFRNGLSQRSRMPLSESFPEPGAGDKGIIHEKRLWRKICSL